MKETDCRKCCVCAFKEDLCNGDFCEKYYREGNTEDFEKLLPHWIPCSERLPEPRTAVLGYAPKYQNIFAVYYDSVCGWMIWSPIRDDYFPNSQGEIIAWMPLPKPYRGE